MIYTSYFAKMRKIPSNIVPISIARITPKWYKGLEFKDLAPNNYLLIGYKNGDIDEKEYADIFAEQLISLGKCSEVVKKLYQLSEGNDIVLLCYESAEKFCHRHLVAKWLNKNGYDCQEFNP